MPDLVQTALFGLTLLAVVGAGEALRAWAGWAPEASRRFVHAATGLAVALCPPFFAHPMGIYVLAALFVVVNIVAVRRRLFLGMHGIERETWGTVAFPLALLAALFLCWTLDPSRIYILQAAFLVLAVSDPLAAWVGAHASGGAYRVNGQTKTVAGSAAFVASAAGLVAVALLLWAPEALGWREFASGAAVAAVLAGVAEALGTRGWDNLLIVLAVIVALAALDAAPRINVRARLRPLACSSWRSSWRSAFGALSVRIGFLDLSGALAAGLLAWAVVALGGIAWAVPGFTFFFASSVLSRLGRHRKREAEARAEKGSRRDAAPVLANGGVAGGLPGGDAVRARGLWRVVLGLRRRLRRGGGRHVGHRDRHLGRWRDARCAALAARAAGRVGRRVARGDAGRGSRARPSSSAPPSRSRTPLAGGRRARRRQRRARGVGRQRPRRDGPGPLPPARRACGTERPSLDGAPLPLARGWRWVTNDRVNLACTLVGGLVPLAVLAWG